MMPLRPQAITILNRVKKLALIEPKRMSMGQWFISRDNLDHFARLPQRGFPACGTVGCIGGWVEKVYREEHPRSRKEAGEILGIDHEQFFELFVDSTLMHARNQQTTRHAKAVAAHIDCFIKKYR